MKKIIYYCDRCGKEIVGGNIKINPMYENLGPDRKQYVFEENCERDYCMECAEEIQAFMLCVIKNKQEKEPSSEKFMQSISKGGQEKEISEAAPKKRQLDTGKIIALRKAGWTQTKIAEEMGTSQTIISGILKQAENMEVKNTIESM